MSEQLSSAAIWTALLLLPGLEDARRDWTRITGTDDCMGQRTAVLTSPIIQRTCLKARQDLRPGLPDANGTSRSHIASHNHCSKSVSEGQTDSEHSPRTYSTGCLYHLSEVSLLVASASSSRSSP